MATNFIDGTKFPRRGRTPLGQFLWLARIIDKGRASAAGTLGEYFYPCPIDRGMLEHWGITPDEFNAALAHHDDETLLAWAQTRVAPQAIEAANSFVSVTYVDNLDRQDREEYPELWHVSVPS